MEQFGIFALFATYQFQFGMFLFALRVKESIIQFEISARRRKTKKSARLVKVPGLVFGLP